MSLMRSLFDPMVRIFPLVPVAALSLLLVAGCGEDPATSPAPPAKKAVRKPAPRPEPVPAEEEALEPEPPAYVYDPSGRRDPFQPYTGFQKRAVERTEPRTPLERFDLQQLRLIAVIIGKGEPRAMVTAPDGKSYILKKGVKVGKENGRVVDIEPEAVQVKEQYYDFSGDIRTSIKEITLPNRGGA